MDKKKSIKLFEQKQIRSNWDNQKGKWYFSIVDVIEILTNQLNHQGARNYWRVLKNRLLKEGNETVTNCNRLKMIAEDDKIIFSGNVSSENNSGFASLRSPVKDDNFEKFAGLEIKLKGDGKRYIFSMKKTTYFKRIFLHQFI